MKTLDELCDGVTADVTVLIDRAKTCRKHLIEAKKAENEALVRERAMTATRCLLDLDGVLADFVGGACARFGKDRTLVTAWGIEAVLGIPPGPFWAALDEDFWAALPFTAEAFDILRRVERRFGAENVCLLSSPTRHPGSLAGKVRWIEAKLPSYRRRYLLGPRKEFCAGPDRMLIDDYDANVAAWAGPAFLVPRPWNAAAAREGDLLALLDAALGAL